MLLSDDTTNQADATSPDGICVVTLVHNYHDRHTSKMFVLISRLQFK